MTQDEIIKTAREAQTQEPWCMKMNGCKTKCEDCPDEPPQRTWVNLTVDELIDLEHKHLRHEDLARAIEAKLKELNT